MNRISSFIRPLNSPFYRSLKAELKSDHAGEYGAVRIYDGIIFGASRLRNSTYLLPLLNWAKVHSKTTTEKDLDELLDFAQDHRQSEMKHLEAMKQLLPHRREQTAVLPVWWASGFALGFVPVLVAGPRGAYETVAHVEEFVDRHYQFQIDLLDRRLLEIDGLGEEHAVLADLRRRLQEFQSDELSHMNDARSRMGNSLKSSRLWRSIIQNGSSVAVTLSKVL